MNNRNSSDNQRAFIIDKNTNKLVDVTEELNANRWAGQPDIDAGDPPVVFLPKGWTVQ